MKSLKLYRGITVAENEVDLVIHDIKTNGLYQHENQQWGGFIWKNLKKEINTLYNKEDLTREDTSPASVWIGKKTKKVYKNWQEAPTSENGVHREYIEGEKSICFADKMGGEYYATKHNVTREHTVPLLITVELELKDIAVDGRDFLYTVFGFIDSKDLSKTKRQTEKLKVLFGSKIEYYLEKVIKHPESEKCAICDLAIVDNDIIIEHAKNQKIIGGRYNTTFRSAFFGKVPLLSSQIISVEKLSNNSIINHPEITLNDILER